jgi:signal recognition particle subunit SRP54
MFENLTDKLQRAFKTLRGQGTLTEENIAEALREIRVALLEADVNLKVAQDLIEQIRVKAVGTEVLTALSPSEQVIKIVRDELITLLGKDTARFKFSSQPPTVILMAGLQGSGKTTTSGKLAAWLKKGGHRPMLVSVDVYRPAEGRSSRFGSCRASRQRSAPRSRHHGLRHAHRRHRRPPAY